MNVVIYNEDLEAITVTDLSVELLKQLATGASISIKSHPTLKNKTPNDVVIRPVKIQWIDEKTRTVYVTRNEVDALELKTSWLPGQQEMINSHNEYEKILTNKLMKYKK